MKKTIPIYYNGKHAANLYQPTAQSKYNTQDTTALYVAIVAIATTVLYLAHVLLA